MSDDLGRYKILEEIGRGGFAIVYQAQDIELDRLVALKELRQGLLPDSDWVKRFKREAKTIARLNHPRIVTIYDVLEVAERLFIVMHLVDGSSLDALIATQDHLPWPQALEIILAMADALDYAHTQSILHRDLKPANILLDSQRGPLLSDFGLAKLAGEAGSSVTAGGGIVGTPHYIAPEVWEGQGTTPQSDIYALGCILYEMVTGEKLFQGESPPAVMMAHFGPMALPHTWPEFSIRENLYTTEK
jgi:serine/threonine-protein kinase